MKKNLPYMTFMLPEADHGDTWVELTFLLRYQVTPFKDCGQQRYEVEVLDAELDSAVAWIGDSGENVSCVDKNFCVSAVGKFWQYMTSDYALRTVQALCLADYEKDVEAARELAYEFKSERY